MESNVLNQTIYDFETYNGTLCPKISLSYQIFGQPLHTAPVVLVNHALTGNSNVSGKKGWWNSLIGDGKCIDTKSYTVVSFNIPGNGFDGITIKNYKDFIARDIAKIFLLGLKQLNISKLFAIIGGSLGGGIAWEMAVLKPDLSEHLIPVASDWKATDWLIANCQIQEQILANSKHPVSDARMHAMLCYRTPESFEEKFQRSINSEEKVFNVESWLLHHGKKLQERFQLSAYKLMNQLLKTIDVTSGKEEGFKVLETIKSNIHIVGVDSDLFFSADENRKTFKELALASNKVTYSEINSVHGHDAFLIEFGQLEKILKKIFKKDHKKSDKMKVLKFGGKSLANGKGLDNVIEIISNKVLANEKIAVVLSARGNSTDDLEGILEKAKHDKPYKEDFEKFKNYQLKPGADIDFSHEFALLEKIFEGVHLLRDYSLKIKDQVLSQGEVLSGKLVAAVLNKKGVKANFTDSRALIKTDATFGEAQPLEQLSKENVQKHFEKNQDSVQVFTGFIASNLENETTTLGRNGSNYSASLLANFLEAEELESYTHVNGIYTANPDLVSNANKIEELSFQEANELANFGANILHAKTIIPLIEKNIPLRILNTFDANNKGTLITSKSARGGIKSLSVQENVSLINLEGRGLLGKVGVDARIFTSLSKENISVGIISQGSSERGIGFIVDDFNAEKAKEVLEREFSTDFESKDVTRIYIKNDVSVVSIIGQDLSNFHHSYAALTRNNINPVLINNTVTGKNICLVLENHDLHKAVNVIHGQIFGISKTINIAVFGKGLVGGTLINQILKSKEDILKRRNINLNIFAVANSKSVLLDKNGIAENWEEQLNNQYTEGYSVDNVIDYAEKNHLENLIAVDNTASEAFVLNYIKLVDNGFDLVSSNKIGNTIDFAFYEELRKKLHENEKKYLYETNVGAGLPLIDTIKLLHHSGENITRIKGVFSGSLSYLFNNYSIQDRSFSEVLQEAIDKGFTEPDPREDLCGNDVGRKLLILARELDLKNEFSDVTIKNLIPENLRGGTAEDFLSRLEELNATYEELKATQKEDHVLRYIGDLSGDLSKEQGTLEVKLVSVPNTSSLGQVKGSDSIFEIYTESYGEQPLVIQGAGAGAEVTARGVFGDILRLTESAY